MNNDPKNPDHEFDFFDLCWLIGKIILWLILAVVVVVGVYVGFIIATCSVR